MARQGRNINSVSIGWITLYLLIHGRTVSGQCGQTSKLQGGTGSLSQLEHNVSGDVSIIDDCTLGVTDFNYDGQAPAAYWWGGKSCDQKDLENGYRLSDVRLMRSYNGAKFQIKLSSGIDWDNVGCICVWCEDYKANFGDVATSSLKVSPATSPTPSPSPSPLPAPSPSPEPKPSPSPVVIEKPETSPSSSVESPAPSPNGGGGDQQSLLSLANCVELMPNYYNLWWEITPNNTMLIGLEGLVGPGNKWMGFGFSSPDATDVLMTGADVVVGGLVNGECFAMDYYLQTRNQCNWDKGLGVCPDTAGGDGGTSQVKLLECNQIGDKLTILMSRPLGSAEVVDKIKDQNWNDALNGSRFTVWAMGPVSEASNSTRPVVLYHNLQLPGQPEPMFIHAPLGKNYKVNLQQEGNFCAALTGAPPAPGPAPALIPPAVIEGVTVFDVTTGTNANYPNPPAWGLSYHINDLETPVLKVVRGTEYTFNVKAGPQHPVYITTSEVGGSTRNSDNADEQVFAGGLDSYGTEEEPFALKWTPDATVPHVVYYQCHVHQKLGWKIEVVDAGEGSKVNAQSPSSSGAPPPPSDAVSAFGSILNVATTLAASMALSC